MKIFITPGAPLDDSLYLQEILKTFAPPCIERGVLGDVLRDADPKTDVLILPHGSEIEGVEKFLKDGGSVIAIHPDQSLASLVGLKHGDESETPSRLRFVQPVCYGTRGEALWTLGSRRLYDVSPDDQNCTPIAFGFSSDADVFDSIGIAEYSVGAGRLIVYAYDIAECVRRLRQGFPERANFLPPGQETPRAAFLQEPRPPADTFWKPTADMHARAFCEIARGLLQQSTPVPTIWHLPDGAASLLLFSGDEDAAPKENDETEMIELEERGAAMNLYLFPEDTSLERKDLEEYSQRGHTVSVHPYVSDTAGQAPEIQLQKARQQVNVFREKFDWPVKTVRNHSYFWPGYLQLPELWEELGIGMDCNTTSLMRGDSMEWGPFAKLHAAMPLRFAREDGTLIDVFAQPTQLNDDIMFHSTSIKSLKYSREESENIFERVLLDASQIYHAPVCVNFHPYAYVNFSGPAAKALLSRAREMNINTWTIDRWHDFWRARDSWQLQSSHWDGNSLQTEWAGEPCEGLTIALPLEFQDRKLQRILVDEDSKEIVTARRFGRDVAFVALPKFEHVKVCAVYSGAGESA